MLVERFQEGQGTAVLLSGGLDSAVLLAHVARHDLVQPLYIRVGLAWETEEHRTVTRLLASGLIVGDIRPLATLRVDMTDIYSSAHWAVRGVAPGFDTPDENVYLDGRNVVLLAKASVFMARTQLHRIAMGSLAGNPFPDATAEFFDAMARALSIGLATTIHIDVPFSAMHKVDVIRLGQSLGVPFDLTLSCMQPVDGQHCGRCSKCRERRDGFREAGVADPTTYAAMPAR
jgi:7-cyano-7-deazaguanine synthase